MRRVLAIITLFMAWPGPGFAAEPVPYATCVNTAGTCLAYVGKNTKDLLPYVVNGCKGQNNTWSTNTRCPAQNRIGICKNAEGEPDEMWTVVYKTVYTSAKEAQVQCERDLKGKWH